MTKTPYRILQALILLGLAAFLTEKWISGRLSWYIGERFIPLAGVTILGFCAMAIAGCAGLLTHRRKNDSLQNDPDACACKIEPEPDPPGIHQHSDPAHHHHPSGFSASGLILIGLPLLIGILFPVSTLNADSLDTRGFTSAGISSGINVSTSRLLEAPADQRTILQWIQLFNYSDDPRSLLGEPADVIGFVYHDPRLSEDQFMVSRFSFSCCIADALALGMVVNWEGAGDLPDNTWVRVQGSLQSLTLEGQTVPLIQADSIEEVDQPEEPYLFP